MNAVTPREQFLNEVADWEGKPRPFSAHPMNGFCRTLDCFFGTAASSDCASDGYDAIYVYRDGNVHTIGHFDTEEEAEQAAGAEHARQLQDNSQFGVGS